jgi:hypothetical protein
MVSLRCRIGSLLPSVGIKMASTFGLVRIADAAGTCIPGTCNRKDLMRAHHAIAIVAIILIGFGLKLTFFSAPPAEADARSVESVRMDPFPDATEY